MWNVKITILQPTLEEIKILHNSNNPHVLIVHYGEDNLEGHYCATVGNSEKWVPVEVKTTHTI